MQQFFSSMLEIEQFSLSLNSLATAHACPHCCRCDQWVSHGYLYKQSGDIAGKRILCAKRYGKLGCGRTRPLYLQQIIPGRRYTLSTLLAFVLALINGSTVEQAYCLALQHPHYGHRQAWRWLNALWARMGVYRAALANLPHASTEPVKRSSRRLSLLLCTWREYWHHFPEKHRIQSVHQARFC